MSEYITRWCYAWLYIPSVLLKHDYFCKIQKSTRWRLWNMFDINAVLWKHFVRDSVIKRPDDIFKTMIQRDPMRWKCAFWQEHMGYACVSWPNDFRCVRSVYHTYVCLESRELRQTKLGTPLEPHNAISQHALKICMDNKFLRRFSSIRNCISLL